MIAPLARRITRLVAAVVLVGLVASLPAGCAEPSDVTVTRGVVYGSNQGVPLELDVLEPADRLRLPGLDTADAAIVTIHGGAWQEGDKADIEPTAEGFARAGFVVFNINYAIGPPGTRFPSQIADAQLAVRWVREHAEEFDVDPDRVGVYGSSAGGNLAMMVGVLGDGSAENPEVQAVASWSGISELAILSSPDGQAHPEDPPPGCMGQDNCIGVLTPNVFPDYVGCVLAVCPADYDEASPIYHVSEGAPPMYLTAGSEDFVPFDQSRRMAEALDALGVTTELVEVPNGVHAEGLRDQALDPTIAFFQGHLVR